MRSHGESPFGLFITTVISHVTIVPVLVFFYKQHAIFELCVAAFSLLASIMYHTAESFNRNFFLSELQWHRLDNVGVISSIGIWCVCAAGIQSLSIDMALKYAVLLTTIVLQQKHPWDVRLTVSPVLVFGMIPVVHHCFIRRALPAVRRKCLIFGIALLVLALPCFALGCDENKDPYRVFHGMWHFAFGLSSLFLWMAVTHRHSPSYGGPQVAAASTTSVMMSMKSDAFP